MINQIPLFIAIQTRLNSSRFPQKALFPILGLPLIIRVIQRMQSISIPHLLVLLTPKSEQELFRQLLIQYDSQIPVFGGSEENVLERYFKAATFFNIKHLIMRVTGDNPLVSIPLAEKLFKLHQQQSCDLSHFTQNPSGTGVELLTYQALKKSYDESQDPYEQEHVTQYIYQNPKKFHIFEPVSPYINKNISCISVDYPEDIEKIELLLSQNPHWDISLSNS